MASWEALLVGTVDGGICGNSFSFDSISIPANSGQQGCVVFQAKTKAKQSRF